MATTINYIFHPSIREGGYPGKVRMRITHERKSRSVTLPFAVFPEEWDGNSRTLIIPKDPDHPRHGCLSKALERMESNVTLVHSIADSLEENGRYSIEDIMAQFQARDDNGKLMNYALMLAGELACKGQERTGRAYLTVSRGLINFNKGKDIHLKHINARLMEDLEADLKGKGRAPNTISYYMRNLRAIYNKAVSSKRIRAQADDPFAGVYTGVSKTRKRALPEGELKQLYNLDFSRVLSDSTGNSEEHIRMQKLYFSWRLFFFCLHAQGMCFVDMAYLRKDNIRNGVITYYRRKTGVMVEIKVTSKMREIIESFREDVAGSEYVFPIITDSKRPPRPQYENGLNIQNKRLKQLCRLAGIRSAISTHVARHTWASMCKFNNVPLWVISEGLGHNNERFKISCVVTNTI